MPEESQDPAAVTVVVTGDAEVIPGPARDNARNDDDSDDEEGAQ